MATLFVALQAVSQPRPIIPKRTAPEGVALGDAFVPPAVLPTKKFPVEDPYTSDITGMFAVASDPEIGTCPPATALAVGVPIKTFPGNTPDEIALIET